MRQVFLGIRLTFQMEKRSDHLARKIAEAVINKPVTPKPGKEPGARLRVEKDKETVTWESDCCGIQIEDITDIERCIRTLAATLELINQNAPIGRVKERTLSSGWIFPIPNSDFASAERKYRQTMIVQNELGLDAYDSSVIFDITKGDWTLHHQSGIKWLRSSWRMII